MLRILRDATRDARDRAARRRRLAASLAVLRAARRDPGARVEIDDRGARLSWSRSDGGRCLLSGLSFETCAEARAAAALGLPVLDRRGLRPAPDRRDARGS